MNVTTVLTFLFSMVLLVGGLLLMAYSFEVPGWEGLIFTAGATAEFLAVAVPALLWGRENRRSQQ
ncbi:hypothetical protein [Agrococcus beijingensis]|uniref:hypothetical protein n=1 Tax=Agrococcus beijingensis TaxID=3068634 RepID=UPI0027424FC0|nr:hypothetical protein [Agrococcus sp. REN33]